MNPLRSTPSTGPVTWAAEIVELAAVFLAVGTAHLFVSLVGDHADGGTMVLISGVALLVGTVLHRWWGARARRPAAAEPQIDALRPVPTGDHRIWRVRATLADRPGSLAALSGKLAALKVNILAIQVHPSSDAVADELLVAAPGVVTAKEVSAAVEAGGGAGVHIVVAEAHDLADPPTRALTLAAAAAVDPDTLPHALGLLLGGATVDRRPAENSVALSGPDGDALYLSRPGLPFTATELARAKALVDLCTQLATT